MEIETNGTGRGNPITDQEVARMAELAAMGMPQAQIAEKVKRSKTSVHRVLSKKAKPMPKKKAAKAPVANVAPKHVADITFISGLILLAIESNDNGPRSTVKKLLTVAMNELYPGWNK